MAHIVSITLPDVIEFRRADHIMEIKSALLSTNIIAQLVSHGATQKVGDAAAGKDGARAHDAMQAVIETLYAGDWGRTRGAASSEPAHYAFIRTIIRGKLGEASKAEYKAIDSSDQDAREQYLMGKFEGLSEESRDAIESVAQDMLAQAQAAKRAAKGISVNL